MTIEVISHSCHTKIKLAIFSLVILGNLPHSVQAKTLADYQSERNTAAHKANHEEKLTQAARDRLAKLKAEKIPYVLIAPKINQIGDMAQYMNVMHGKISYMRYFKGSLWDALAQDYAAKLAASLKEEDLTLYERTANLQEGGEALFKFLSEKIPDFEKIVEEEMETLRIEMEQLDKVKLQ